MANFARAYKGTVLAISTRNDHIENVLIYLLFYVINIYIAIYNKSSHQKIKLLKNVYFILLLLLVSYL